MKVLFIQENAISESIGLCCLSAYLKRGGHQCDLILASHSNDLFKEIKDFGPGLIGFTAFTGMEKSLYELIYKIKSKFDIPVIVGGPWSEFGVSLSDSRLL